MEISEEERKARKKEYNKKYHARPEVKARKKVRDSKPEHKEKHRLSEKERRNRPEVKAKSKEYHAIPEVKAKAQERRKTPHYIAVAKKRRGKPENLAKEKEYSSRHEVLVRRQNVRSDKRLRILQAYSKRLSNSDIPCCRCCGESSSIEFLAIDHIAGRKQMDSEPELVKLGYSAKWKTTNSLLLWLIKNNFPAGFQILCHNCNHAKGHSKDHKCPHERTN